jgi:hypothetical protein
LGYKTGEIPLLISPLDDISIHHPKKNTILGIISQRDPGKVTHAGTRSGSSQHSRAERGKSVQASACGRGNNFARLVSVWEDYRIISTVRSMTSHPKAFLPPLRGWICFLIILISIWNTIWTTLMCRE